MTKERRTFTPEERLSIVQEGQREGRAQTLRKYNLSPSLYNKWRTILSRLGVTNHRKNYERYLLPLIELNWLAMTIPGKPTSPKQQYLTTLKERLVLELLKYKVK